MRYKRCYDITFLCITLPLWGPLCLVIATAVFVFNGTPVLYSQERLGLNGKVFRFHKFRTMVRNAEKETGPVLADRYDPRVTRIGAVLRRTGLDELAQIYNVVKGDMSLVGHRPERPELMDDIVAKVPQYRERLRIYPGITSLAFIRGGYYLTPRNKIRYDMLYSKRMSWWVDTKIILITISRRILFWSFV